MTGRHNPPAMISDSPRPRRHAARFPPAALAVAFAALLAGCAATPRNAVLPPIAVPAAWSTGDVDGIGGVAASAAPGATPAAMPSEAPGTLPTADPRALASWWRHFDDPLLAGLVERALEANATVGIAQAALRQARALRDVQSARLVPGVDASGSAQRSRVGNAGAANRFDAGLDASWELDLFGANRSAVAAADADTLGAQANLAATRVSLAAEVALVYVELRGLQARLEIARENLGAQAETLQLAQWRAQAGLATSVEVEQARAASEQTAAGIPSLESAIAQARHGLAVLTGRPPGAAAAGLAELADPRPVPRVSGELALAFPAETLRQRPDVHAAEHRVSAALARVDQADALRYPSLRIGGSLGLSALTLGGLASSGATVANSLLAGLTVPLFDGGALLAQLRAQEASFEQARLDYEAVVLGALQEVEDALVALRGDRERLARLRNAAEAAGNAALLAQANHASGLVDFQVVLDTQRSLLATQDAVATTTASVGADHVRLYKALGGGWQPDGSITNQAPDPATKLSRKQP